MRHRTSVDSTETSVRPAQPAPCHSERRRRSGATQQQAASREGRCEDSHRKGEKERQATVRPSKAQERRCVSPIWPLPSQKTAPIKCKRITGGITGRKVLRKPPRGGVGKTSHRTHARRKHRNVGASVQSGPCHRRRRHRSSANASQAASRRGRCLDSHQEGSRKSAPPHVRR